jgi:hypothetical protein
MGLGAVCVDRLGQARRNVFKTRARSWARRAVRDGLYDGIDREAIATTARDFKSHYYQKYNQRFHHTCVRNAERIFALSLHEGPKRAILDLGTGFGLFPYAARELGHTVVGLDQSDPFFDAVAPIIGIERVLHRIEPFAPLPEIPGAPFSLITAFATCFDEAGTSKQWGVQEWHYFLGDLRRFMAPGCRLYVKFNQYHGGGARAGALARAVPDDLMDYFCALGAQFRKRAMDLNDAPERIASGPAPGAPRA